MTKANSRLIWVFLALATFCLLLPPPAQAYLDPGTSSFFIQCVLGAILGVGVSLKLFWKRIAGRFTGKKPKTTTEPIERVDD